MTRYSSATSDPALAADRQIADGANTSTEPGTRRKILVVTNTLRGGTGAHIVRLMAHLEADGWQPIILCHGGRDFDPPDGVTLIDDSLRGRFDRFPLAQWRQLKKLARLVRQHRPDVVHTFFFWPIMYGRILKRVGIVRHLIENREDQGFIWSGTDYRLLRATATIPDRIVCVSDAVRSVVMERERPPEDRTVVIRNGVHLPARAPSATDLEAARAEFGFEPHHRIVGMVANLQHAVKGAQYLVEAVPFVVRQIPDARFLVLGEGREREQLRALAQSLGVEDHIVFAGFRTDVHRFYPIMDVSVLTSLSEGLSITILESMSFGIPVVATRVGGNAELVRDGESGILVPPRDPSTFGRAVIRILDDRDLQQELGRNGRRIVQRDFSLREVSVRYDRLYRDVQSTSGSYAS